MNQAQVLVADASVAVKWVLNETHSDRADQLLADCAADNRAIAAPPHLYAEVTNALFQRPLRSDPAVRISDAAARQALVEFLSIPIQLLSPAGLYDEAYDFGRTYTLRSIYDSLYVVLARQLGCELWTADGRLLDALGTAAPWVRFIGDYPLTT